jgi:hypothetical protein
MRSAQNSAPGRFSNWIFHERDDRATQLISARSRLRTPQPGRSRSHIIFDSKAAACQGGFADAKCKIFRIY